MFHGKTVIAIIQAHMSSTRLPNKIMLDLHGKPELYRVLERVKKSKYLDDIVVATSDLPCDDIIANSCKEWGIHSFRGSDSDVLSRFYGAAMLFPADAYMRLTSDNPISDPDEIDHEIEYFFNSGLRHVRGDYTHLPHGIGEEVFTAELLQEAYEKATEPFEHEHVTPYMYRNQSSTGIVPTDMDDADIRVTMDTENDYRLLCAIYDHLYSPNRTFTLDEAVSFIRSHPEILEINSMVKDNSIYQFVKKDNPAV